MKHYTNSRKVRGRTIIRKTHVKSLDIIPSLYKHLLDDKKIMEVEKNRVQTTTEIECDICNS